VLGFLLSVLLAILYVIFGVALWHRLTFYTLIALAVPFIAAYAALGARRQRAKDQ
jgi:purine-cytosine permease-like protein